MYIPVIKSLQPTLIFHCHGLENHMANLISRHRGGVPFNWMEKAGPTIIIHPRGIIAPVPEGILVIETAVRKILPCSSAVRGGYKNIYKSSILANPPNFF
jgi:hypothetical protein